MPRGTLLCKFIDLDSNEKELRCNQENDGTDGSNTSYKGCHKTTEEGILNQRQGDCHEDLEGIGSHIISGLLNGLIYLPKGGNTTSSTCRQRSDYKYYDQNYCRTI